LLTNKQNAAYDQFLLSLDGSLFYQSLQHKRFIEELLGCNGHYLLATEDGTIRGALPLMKTLGKYGTVYNSLPYYGSNGGVIAVDQEAYQRLRDTYNRLARAEDTAGSTLIETPQLPGTGTGIVHDLTDTRIGQWTEIGFENDAGAKLMQAFHYKTRNMIRKAAKSKVDVDIDNSQIDFLRQLHRENMSAIGGKAKPDRFFNLIDKHFSKEKDYDIFIARKGGAPIGALLVFYFNKTVEYYMPVVKVDSRTYQPLSLIIHQAMVESARRGYKYWNWGGTWLTQEGVFRFKKRWGTINREYHYHIAINNKNIYRATQEEMLANYDYFYVIPFKLLETNHETH
jgi:hypothetical protein